MSMLVCLGLALVAQDPMIAPEPAARQAMLEYRVVEAVLVEPSDAAALSGRVESMTAFELDILLMALESGRNGRLPVPDLGEIDSSRIISAPRIIAQAGEAAHVESGVQVPVVNTASGMREINVEFRPSLSVDSRWVWETPAQALVETKADHLGTMLAGTLRMREGETVYLASVRGGRAVVVFLTFRPLN